MGGMLLQSSSELPEPSLSDIKFGMSMVTSGCRGESGGERGAEWRGMGGVDVEGGGDRRGPCRGEACAAGALNRL